MRRVPTSDTSHLEAPSIGLGSGRLLRSQLSAAACLANLEAILVGYGPPKGVVVDADRYRTPYVAACWRWAGPQSQAPETVVSFQDSNGEVLFAAFWPRGQGADVAVFPLGVGDARLAALPIIGDLKQRDPSLTSVGVIPSDQVVLMPPKVTDAYFVEMLEVSGFPLTLHNVGAVGGTVSRMFLGKAHQFIASHDPRAADRFVKDHSAPITSFREHCQGILDDLGRWNPTVLLYIQDLPMRIRAIALLAINEMGSIGGDTLER